MKVESRRSRISLPDLDHFWNGIFIAVQQDQCTPALEPALMGTRIRETKPLTAQQRGLWPASVLVADGQPDPQPNLGWAIPKPPTTARSSVLALSCS